MFQTITPERAGISSAAVTGFVRSLEKRGLVMHSVLLMKGQDIFGEFYWKPFHKDLCHRMYSQTKSFVGVAVGLLEQDGLIRLDDRICTYFPGPYARQLPPYLEELTIRQMLTMQTGGETPSWFRLEEQDRTKLYFEQNTADHPAGMQYKYDSPGCQVLSTLVERLTGKRLFDYLDTRIFQKLGTFRTASILKTRNGDSFGDSALLCTTRDMASFARFVMNYGTWQGQQLVSRQYLQAATSRQTDNNLTGFDSAFTQGYGYLIWCVPGGFAFNGMGAQLTLCIPALDLIFCCTGDNQGFPAAKDLILSAFYEQIVEAMQTSPLPEDPSAAQACLALADSLTLFSLQGRTHSPLARQICGRQYLCRDNPMGIRAFSLEFLPEGTGVFHYSNEQGEKHLKFGLGRNIFGKFPQAGYSALHAGAPGPEGHYYDCAASAIWCQPDKLRLKVQIIDRYLGNLQITFSFREDMAVVTMAKTAEAFLNEYQGQLVAVTGGSAI